LKPVVPAVYLFSRPKRNDIQSSVILAASDRKASRIQTSALLAWVLVMNSIGGKTNVTGYCTQNFVDEGSNQVLVVLKIYLRIKFDRTLTLFASASTIAS